MLFQRERLKREENLTIHDTSGDLSRKADEEISKFASPNQKRGRFKLEMLLAFSETSSVNRHQDINLILSGGDAAMKGGASVVASRRANKTGFR